VLSILVHLLYKYVSRLAEGPALVSCSATIGMIGIDLFSGAGGMSLGAEWAGISVRTAIDLDENATATYRANHRAVNVVTCDIASVKNIAVEHVGSRNEQIVIFGGPPCQGFSTSNQRTRTKENPLNWLFKHYLRIVMEMRPEWVVFENVKGIRETEGGFFLRSVLKRLARGGYTVSEWVLNAADYGVPQRRFRLFVIASLQGKKVKRPSPTTARYVTVGEAILDLPVLLNGASTDVLPYRTGPRSEYAGRMRSSLKECGNHLVTENNKKVLERYRHIPKGGNWEDIPRSLMDNYADTSQCHTGIYRRLKLREPSVVIGNFRKNMLIHPTQARGLSVREAARLQSFPDDFRFVGSIGFQQQQVGNAVPPLMAKAVFAAIHKVAK
jgi:DNA (cytosine-5)-methyltransferase 1